MVFLPPTTDFPPNPALLDRATLESTYLELRNSYSSSIRSRAQHRRRSAKARDEASQLREHLLNLATREASVRKEVYAMLDIVTAIAGDMEDAGDDLVKGYGAYMGGRRTFQGGGYLGALIRAVISFINRWRQTKDRLGEFQQQHQAFLQSRGEVPLEPVDHTALQDGDHGRNR